MVTMTEYSKDLPVLPAFPKITPPKVLTEILSLNGKKQLHISETEKYPHVTFFFSNGHEEPFSNESWEQVHSNTSYQNLYENVPQMAAFELTKKLITRLQEPIDFYLVNYANPDMVGHTGSLDASIKAVQTVDQCLRMLTEFVFQAGDILMIITGDHGNVEEIHNVHTGRVEKSHSTNPVPCVFVGSGLRLKNPRKAGYLYLATQVPEGQLSDIAPTVLEVLGIEKPPEMSGLSLISSIDKLI